MKRSTEKRVQFVEILGEPTSVKYKKLKSYGTYQLGEIEINNTKSTRIQLRTVLHEFFHGIYEDSHDPDDRASEEDCARMFEQGCACLFRDNMELVTALIEEYHG